MLDPKAGERSALGARCRELAQSPMFTEAVSSLDLEYREAIVRTAPADNERREQLYLEYHGLFRVVSKLKSWEQDGVLAQAELESEQ